MGTLTRNGIAMVYRSLRTQRFYDDDDGLLLDRQNCMNFPSRQLHVQV